MKIKVFILINRKTYRDGVGIDNDGIAINHFGKLANIHFHRDNKNKTTCDRVRVGNMKMDKTSYIMIFLSS